MANWIKSHLLICLLGTFFLGAVGSGIAYTVIGNGRLGQLDTELAAGRAAIARLTVIGSQLESENSRLTSLNEQQRRGIAEAAAIVGRQQSATADIVEKLRRVIETLQAVKAKLAAISNLK